MSQNQLVPFDESAPQAQIARFDDWRKAPYIEMAYNPAPNDYLLYTLGPNYQAPPYTVPFGLPDGNGMTGRLYGTNDIPILNDMQCTPFVDSCKSRNGYVVTRAPDQKHM